MNDVNSFKCFLKCWIVRLHFYTSILLKLVYIFVYLFIYLFISKPIW